MAGSTPAELIAQLAASFRAAPNGVRALLAPPRFGELEQVEAAKFTPPAAAECESGNLPASYGQMRLMLMVTGPYRVYAYWDVPAGVPREGSAALRFYNAEAGAPAEWFDIDVDLESHNHFVDVWSPDRAYRAELGLRRGPEFEVLASSNVVRTPRAWPKTEPGEHYLRVEPEPPAVGSEPAPPALPVVAWDVLTKKLAELSGHREWHGEVFQIPPQREEPAPENAFTPVSGGPPLPEPAGAPPARTSPPHRKIQPRDLTATAEEQFRAGISSGAGQGTHDGK